VFTFFVVLNLACTWAGLFTAFPEYLHDAQGRHYFLIQFPVDLLGAVFDSLSFFITIAIVRRALVTHAGWTYVSHLSLDGVIAILATFWVLFVFVV